MWSRVLGNRVPILVAATAVPFGYGAYNQGVVRKQDEDFCKNVRIDLLSSEERKSKARDLIHTTMTVAGIPGLTIGVSVNGNIVWKEGFGFSNVEDGSKCKPDTVMRIASISKPFTATVAARLVEDQKLDLDKDIREYLPDYPQKKFERRTVKITTRQLLSHSGGIRHYHTENPVEEKEISLEDPRNSRARTPEFSSNVPYNTVTEALEMFKNDDLVAEPGSKFSYTTHGLTLASAVLEKAAGKDFPKLLRELFFELGLQKTDLDVNTKIIPGRASYYRRNNKHVLENCPEVDNSYKWAGGGLLSNVSDLLVFANAILYSQQHNSKNSLIGQETMREFLQPQIDVESGVSAALGWMNVPGKDVRSVDGKRSKGGFFFHTGGAMGASSVLLIRPANDVEASRPSGICVVILCNLQETSVLSLAHQIEEIFRN